MQDKIPDAERIHRLGLSGSKGEVVSGVDVKKILEWAGFRPATQEEYSPGSYPQPDMAKRGWGWYYPNGRIEWYLPDILNSVDACMEYLEPSLYERFGIYHIGFARIVGDGYNCYMNRWAFESPYGDCREEGRSKELTTLGYGESRGEAFCDAAWKVINKYSELIKPLSICQKTIL